MQHFIGTHPTRQSKDIHWWLESSPYLARDVVSENCFVATRCLLAQNMGGAWPKHAMPSQ